MGGKGKDAIAQRRTVDVGDPSMPCEIQYPYASLLAAVLAPLRRHWPLYEVYHTALRPPLGRFSSTSTSATTPCDMGGRRLEGWSGWSVGCLVILSIRISSGITSVVAVHRWIGACLRAWPIAPRAFLLSPRSTPSPTSPTNQLATRHDQLRAASDHPHQDQARTSPARGTPPRRPIHRHHSNPLHILGRCPRHLGFAGLASRARLAAPSDCQVLADAGADADPGARCQMRRYGCTERIR
jgi:hypothetical protein